MTETIANRYRILAELGQGNMGAVYRVADTLEGGTELALKVIRVPGAITPELRLLFKEEFRAMAKLRHPNTIAVYGYGELDERSRAVLLGLAIERELVGSRAELRGGELVQRARVSDLVLRDRGERDVLLEEGRDARPLRVAPAEDELVVGEREQQVGAVTHSRLPAPCRASRRARVPRAGAP